MVQRVGINNEDIMVDLINPQIQEGCRLALPEGLQELMSDISREVLRIQPQDLYNFIANYLSVLMVARENISIATRLCDTLCTSGCNPELDDELRYIGLNEEDTITAKKIIVDYFEEGTVKEQSLMTRIAKKTNINESMLPSVQQAIRRAYQRNLINNTQYYEISSDSDLDDVSRAARHTLHLYRMTKPNQEDYERAAKKIQTAYRAYQVRRTVQRNQKPSPREDTGLDKNRNLRFATHLGQSKSSGSLMDEDILIEDQADLADDESESSIPEMLGLRYFGDDIIENAIG